MKYLVVKCNELGDQWECDADRTPICLTDDYSKYNRWGYEIYEVKEDNTFKLIRNYEDVSKTEICVAFWNDEEVDNFTEPYDYEVITDGNRFVVTKSLVKKIKKDYHFEATVNEIYQEIQCSGAYGELIFESWVTFGEKHDDYFSKGY